METLFLVGTRPQRVVIFSILSRVGEGSELKSRVVEYPRDSSRVMKKFLSLIFNAKSDKNTVLGSRDMESMSIPYILQCTIQYKALCHAIKF